MELRLFKMEQTKDFFIGIGVALMTFFAPAFPIVLAVGMAIAADTFWGIKASIKKGVPYSSKILRVRLIDKLIKYQLSVISFFIIDRFLLNEVIIHYYPGIEFALTKLLAIGLCVVELSSINESSKMLYKKSFFDSARDFIRKSLVYKKEIDEFNK